MEFLLMVELPIRLDLKQSSKLRDLMKQKQ